MLPWTPFLLLALVCFVVARDRLDAGLRRGALLLVTWFPVVIGIFSISGGKLPHCLLPAYPAGALLGGLLMERASVDLLARRLCPVGAILATIILTVAAVVVGALLCRSTDPPMVRATFILPVLLAAGVVVTVMLGVRRRPLAASAAIAVTVACAFAYASLVAVPRLKGLQPVPLLGASVASAAGPDDRVGHYGVPGLVFYSRHRVDALASHDDVASFLKAPGRAFCVLPGRDAEAVASIAQGIVHELERQPKLVLRFNRLFGQRPLYEDSLVLVSNRPARD